MKKKISKISMIIFITLLLSTTIVYATTYLYNSNEVSYDNTDSTLSSTDIQEALDELYTKYQSKPITCPSGYTCTNKSNIKCKRATTLHTETCSQTSNYCYADGYYASGSQGTTTITYGQTGKIGVLRPGDAFDCKVSTSGGYTERFYYVSDYYDTSTKSFNGDIAVLIYYSDTLNGSISDSGVAYDSSGTNNSGPVIPVTHLPTTTQWNNISLYKTNRQIIAYNNATSTSSGDLPTAFSYSGKAARLLTYQEVYKACYNTPTAITSTGGLINCKFLLENTKYSSSTLGNYGPWLENPRADNTTHVPTVYSLYPRVEVSSISATSSSFGVRPVIEVPKSEIEY